MKSTLYKALINTETSLSVIGLGYVGMTIAVAFSEKIKVIGYDLNKKKIELYRGYLRADTRSGIGA